MGKNKVLHFEENKTFSNLFQPVFDEFKAGYKFKGSWSEKHFLNTKPLVLELGCGKGEYTIGLAKKYPAKNYIGLDKKGARLWRGAKTCLTEEIHNAAFIRIKIEQIGFCFGEGEVDEIWITFPDPVPKIRRIRKRLTSPKFLAQYKKVLKPGGLIHLKTDSNELFDYTLETIESEGHKLIYSTRDLYNAGYSGDAPMIQTYYEQKFLEDGLAINYLQFKLS